MNRTFSQKKIALITARGGSKRIKNKNIINFFGKPLIAYSIIAAKKSKLFSKIFVTTDSIRIKKIVNKYGAETPFLREKKLSDDITGTNEVVADFIKKMKLNDDIICCIYPTAPLIRKKDLREGLKNIPLNNYVFSANLTDQIKGNTFVVKNNFVTKLINKKKTFYKKILTDSGQFYWARAKTWLKRKKIINVGSSVIKVSRKYAHDLNDNNDLLILKKKFRLIKRK